MPFMVILSKKFSRIWEKFWFVIFFIILDLLHHSSLDFFNIFQKKFWFVIVFFKWENLYTWILLCHSSWDFFNNTKVFERKFWCDIFWTREFVCLDAIPSQGNLGTVSELWNALSIISEFFLISYYLFTKMIICTKFLKHLSLLIGLKISRNL